MVEKDENKETQDLIVRDFELTAVEDDLEQEAFFDLLADHIALMIESNLEALLSLMYRMDIDERKVHDALSPQCPEPANVAIARLVLERQQQRVATKRHYRQQPLEDLDEELKF